MKLGTSTSFGPLEMVERHGAALGQVAGGRVLRHHGALGHLPVIDGFRGDHGLQSCSLEGLDCGVLLLAADVRHRNGLRALGHGEVHGGAVPDRVAAARRLGQDGAGGALTRRRSR